MCWGKTVKCYNVQEIWYVSAFKISKVHRTRR